MDQGAPSGQLSSTTSPASQAFPQDLFPLDFLSFIDGTSSSPNISNGFLAGSGGGGGQQPAEAGPSSFPTQQPHQPQPHTYETSPSFDSTGPISDGSSRAGRSSKGRVAKRDSMSGLSQVQARVRSSSQSQAHSHGPGHSRGAGSNGHMSGMEVDQEAYLSTQGMSGYNSQGFEGMDAFVESLGGQFTGMSQGMLQQFEGIHMQSPIVFDPNNPRQAYDPMAQFLAGSAAQQADGDRRKTPAVNMVGGMLTPAASGEMFPQIRMEQMSPMQLEMLARREQMEGMPDLNMLPMLSPAINQRNPGSQYTSPAINPAQYSQSPLEALQEQSRQFQEQLNALQAQQRQLQATAAAVAASQASPFLASNGGHSGGSSGQTRPISTPNVNGSTEPSPQYFSPLTSPALEARQYHSFSGGNPRPPHPLSALSSPALNPLGSSGGAQQTLSPALHPQNNADLSDPEYLRALVNMFEANQQSQTQSYDPSQRTVNGQFASPSHTLYASQPHSHQSSPSIHQHAGLTPMLAPNSASGSSAGSGPGPHRQSLPSKSRPSPLVKPVNHRSHMRHPSTHTSFSQPSSPAILKGIQPGTYLPPAAIDQQRMPQTAGSLASTPSPVDLTQIMPPPPVPTGQRGLTPMTPAALMNLGGGTGAGMGSGGGRKPVLPKPIPQAAAEASSSRLSAGNGNAVGNAAPPRAISKKVGGGASGGISSASTPGAAGTPSMAGKKGQKGPPGKRGVTKASGVGVRAATKAAAAAALIPPEGETRRTSHKAAEQKRRDSLKAGFDELRLLLPPINTEALDPESGEPIPGSSAPRLLPKSSLVPDDNPNRGVSKVALLKFSNEYIVKLHEKIDRREGYIDKLRLEVERLRKGEEGEEVRGEEGVDLLDYDFRAGEEEEDEDEDEDGEGGEDDLLEGDEQDEDDDFVEGDDDDDGMLDDDDDDDPGETARPSAISKKAGRQLLGAGTAASRKSMGATAAAAVKRPVAGRRISSGSTIVSRSRRSE